jgi:hypothetical protein
MNRQQRRSTRKAPLQLNRSAIGDFLATRLYCASNEPLNEDKHTQMLVPFLTALESLRTGHLTLYQYERLMEGNLFAFELAARLHQHGTESTKALLAPTKQQFEAAADRLTELGERFAANGHARFVAKAAELQALRDSFDLLDQLLGVSNEGHALSALTIASLTVKKRKHELGIA